MLQLLIVSNEPDELAILYHAFQRTDLYVSTAANYEMVQTVWGERPADIVVLSEISRSCGRSVAMLRTLLAVPIILLTDPLLEDEHIALLKAGADLIFCRPYSTRLLIHQVPALLRRVNGLPLASLQVQSHDDIKLDSTTRSVMLKNGKIRHLSHLEFRLLYALLVSKGRPLSLENLVERVWGYSGEGDTDQVRKLIYRLRKKIETDTKDHPTFIMTVPGGGYILG